MRQFSGFLLLIALAVCTIPPLLPALSAASAAPPSLRQSTPAALLASNAASGQADPLFHPHRLSYAHNFHGSAIQTFLEERGSALADRHIRVGDRSHTFAEVLVSLSSLYSLNPKLLLALLDVQSGLVSSHHPTAEQWDWAMGYRRDGERWRGFALQLRWAARELRWAIRDYALKGDGSPPPLTFADGSRQEVGPDLSLSRYALVRVLAPTVPPDALAIRLEALVATYARLFDDPRTPPADWPAPAAPFLTRPMERNLRVTSFFDHDAPFLKKNGSLLTYWGRAETDPSFAYDGHTGWDYAMQPSDPVLAAADGMVIFAGNSDDGCSTPARAVIVDHGNGYRTLYWHLSQVNVVTGQPVARGALLGFAGDSGCAFGPHLHFQVQYLGRDVDPYGWCGAEADPWAQNPAGQVSVWLWKDMPSPCEPSPPGVVVVDDDDPGFLSSGAWRRHRIGYRGGSRFAVSSFGGSAARPWLPTTLHTPLVAVWRPALPQAGRYRVLAYVPYALNGLDESRELRYLVRHDGGERLVLADAEQERNWWVELGAYDLTPGEALVSLSTLAGDDRRGVWADAVAFAPVHQ